MQLATNLLLARLGYFEYFLEVNERFVFMYSPFFPYPTTHLCWTVVLGHVC